jgi:hypothetical protein
MKIHPNFDSAIRSVGSRLELQANEVPAGRWQSKDMSKDPAARMKEVLNVSFQVVLNWNENPKVWENDIRPNMPWAEDHFLERVCGKPLNPGVQWANWPWALSADKFRTENGGKFSHTYMERYWPKEAGYSDEAREEAAKLKNDFPLTSPLVPLSGVRYDYGDLNDVVNHLLGDPLSRQAYLPVWFPEDTGVVHGERVPCTLGYHFIQRGGYLHSTYYIRSCDFYRHFRDDLYLSVRLQLWLLQRLREAEGLKGDPVFWPTVKMGTFTFHCVSMHMFTNDWNKLFGKRP